ncbi:MAG: Mur ligase family protein [Rhabdochlamydiaceae bacterium]|nr:Mur ligase family protein [Candidatus Amphrikana amoebophyrae]
MSIGSPYFVELIEKLTTYRNRNRTGYTLDDLKGAFLKLGPFQIETQVVQVVGTNGKGSVVHKVASCLLGKVGQFISPHIFSCTERIQINGIAISERDFIRHYNRILACMEGVHFTFFDTLFLICYSYFQEEKVQYAIFEAGIGARLDATNLLLPTISVLTTLSLDHQDVLGESIDSIAYEKAHVIRKNIPCVLGPKAYHENVMRRAYELNAPLYFVEPALTFEKENQLIAKQVLKLLDREFDESKLSDNLPFRCKRLQVNGVEIILDVAHNLEGFDALFQVLGKDSYFFALAFTSQKNMERVLERLDQKNAQFIIMSDKDCGLIESEHEWHSIESGVNKALTEAASRGVNLCIAGSFYLMEKALQSLELQKTELQFLHDLGTS